MSRLLAAFLLLSVVAADPPDACGPSTPTTAVNCTAPSSKTSDESFATICQPGAMGHEGGAEPPTNRCPAVNYTDGVFSCSCCGAPLFYAVNKYDAQTGWPAFHGVPVRGGGAMKASNASNVCAPGGGMGTEVVCATCGAHLGDYFDDDDHFCIDGVCLVPPGSSAPCPAGPGGNRAAAVKAPQAWGTLRKMLEAKGGAEKLEKLGMMFDHE